MKINTQKLKKLEIVDNACPVLTQFATVLNEVITDQHRHLLEPVIAEMANTRSTRLIQVARRQFIIWRNITHVFPLILDACNFAKDANVLRLFDNTVAGIEMAMEYLSTGGADVEIGRSVDAKAYLFAFACECADKYAHFCVYAYIYACNRDYNPNIPADATDADADRLRDSIAHAYIETLRMAINIKDIERRSTKPIRDLTKLQAENERLKSALAEAEEVIKYYLNGAWNCSGCAFSRYHKRCSNDLFEENGPNKASEYFKSREDK